MDLPWWKFDLRMLYRQHRDKRKHFSDVRMAILLLEQFSKKYPKAAEGMKEVYRKYLRGSNGETQA